MNKFLAVIVFASVSFAQTPEAKPQERRSPEVRKVVDVKYLSGDRAERAVNLVRRFMHPSMVDYDAVLRTVVMIGPADVVEAGEALFRKFDTPGGVKPQAQVQFRLHLVEASPDGSATGVPAEIASAVEQMKKTFAFKGYRLIDTLILQGRGSGEAAISGTLTAAPDSDRTYYNATYKQADVLEDGKTIVVRGFRFMLRVPVRVGANMNFTDTNINTDFTVLTGQKLVIGKVSTAAAANAIFLIVTADVQ